MNMIDLMKVSAGIVLAGSVCGAGICADYKGAQLVHGLYDLQLEDDLADLTTDKIKSVRTDWTMCTLGNGVDNVAKAVYDNGNWNYINFDADLTNEGKILLLGIAKTTKDHETENDNAGWQFFAHMFGDGIQAASRSGIAKTLNAWGDIARREALDWARYQTLQKADKDKIDERVLDYNRSAWWCCGMDEYTMADYIEALDELIENNACIADVEDINFDLMIKNVVANGKRLSAAQTANGNAIWDAQGKFKKEALAEWKTKTTGEARQKAIAEDFIKYMGNQVIGKAVQSGFEAAVCFENRAMRTVGAADAQEVTQLRQELQKKEAELKQAKEVNDSLSGSIGRMRKAIADAKQLGVQINFVTGAVKKVVGAADAQEVTQLRQDLLNKEAELKQAKEINDDLNRSIKRLSELMHKAAADARRLGVQINFFQGTAEETVGAADAPGASEIARLTQELQRKENELANEKAAKDMLSKKIKAAAMILLGNEE